MYTGQGPSDMPQVQLVFETRRKLPAAPPPVVCAAGAGPLKGGKADSPGCEVGLW